MKFRFEHQGMVVEHDMGNELFDGLNWAGKEQALPLAVKEFTGLCVAVIKEAKEAPRVLPGSIDPPSGTPRIVPMYESPNKPEPDPGPSEEPGHRPPEERT